MIVVIYLLRIAYYSYELSTEDSIIVVTYLLKMAYNTAGMSYLLKITYDICDLSTKDSVWQVSESFSEDSIAVSYVYTRKKGALGDE